MKKLMPTIFAILLAGCNVKKNNCTFSQLRITGGSSSVDPVLRDTVIFDCFTTQGPDTTGLIKIKGKNSDVTYYHEDKSGYSQMLTINMTGKARELRSKKGYIINVIGKPDTDTLMFVAREFDDPTNINTVMLIK